MKTIKSFLLQLLLLAIAGTTYAQTAVAPAGTGTASDPYQIATVNNLLWLSQTSSAWAPNKYFIQTANINASSVANFPTIGPSEASSFLGNYDGQNFTISNYKTNINNRMFVGLFGRITSNASIKNLKLQTPTVRATNSPEYVYMGALVGFQAGSETLIENCQVIGGTVSGGKFISGGLAGGVMGTVNNCANSATVSGDSWVGGVSGYVYYGGKILNSSNSANITGTNTTATYAGGIVGYAQAAGIVKNSYSNGNVSGVRYVGGAVGYASGSVSTFENCYATGTVTGTTNVGGFAGIAGITQINCFWDTQTTGRATNYGSATGRTTAQMKTIDTYLNAGWDFQCETANGTADLWKINSTRNGGYPVLSWQIEEYSDNCHVWVGDSNGDWSFSGDWVRGVVPPDGASIIIASYASSDLRLDQDRNVSNITFSGAGRKIVTGSYNLTMKNVLNANTNNYISTTGTGAVYSNIQHGTSANFAVGNGGYTPVLITNNTGATDRFSVNLTPGVFAQGYSGMQVTDGSLKNTWHISKADPNTGMGVTMEFKWSANDTRGIFTLPMLYHYGSSWERLKTRTTVTSSSLTITNYTGSFSPFAILDETSTLPVTWGDITVRKQQDYALLKWTTMTEENTAFYFVQHSTNGADWTILAKVTAAGNSSGARHYQYQHQNPAKANNYYRLLQQDIDGRQEYSKIVSLQWSAEKLSLLVYPNPGSNGYVNVTTATAGTLQVYDNAGAIVKQVSVKAGTNLVDISMLAKGVYRLKSGNESASLLIK